MPTQEQNDPQKSPIVGRISVRDLPPSSKPEQLPGPVIHHVSVSDYVARKYAAEHARETLSMSQPLPSEYQRVLDVVPSTFPPEYQRKMREAAYMFWALDTGKHLSDEQGRLLGREMDELAEQLVSSDFVAMALADPFRQFKIRRGERVYEPSESLPGWLVKKNAEKGQSSELTAEEIAHVHRRYAGYLSTRPHMTRDVPGFGGNIEYFTEGVIPVERKLIGQTAKFKCYIEGKNILAFDQITAALRELTIFSSHPNSIKFYDDNQLVMHWDLATIDFDLLARIKATFKHFALDVRGFGQDVYEVQVDQEGNHLGDQFIFSNDQSLDRPSWEPQPYDASKFFHTYLQVVTQSGKDPTHPYRLGYVRIADPYLTQSNEQHRAKVHILADKITGQSGLPVIISDGSVASLPALQ